MHYSHIPHDPNAARYDDRGAPFVASQTRQAGYTYPSPEIPFRPVDSHDGRVSYVTHAHDGAPPSTNGSSRLVDSHYAYLPAPNHHHNHNGNGTWDASGGGGGQNGRHNQSWAVGNSHDRLPSKILPFPTSNSTNSSSPASPPPLPPLHSHTATATSATTTAAAAATAATSNYFPTLNSPFYPSQTQLQGKFTNSPASSNSHSHYNTPSPQVQPATSTGRSYDNHQHHAYSSSSSNGYSASSSSGTSVNGNGTMYHQQSRVRAELSRPLPPLHSLSHSNSHSTHPIHPNPASSIGFWGRDNIDG